MKKKIKKLIPFSLEEKEKNLSPLACLSTKSLGRKKQEEESHLRTAFMRDRDRIIHSTSFRRLKHKAQVFLLSANDMIRTRLTHTLEVAQIARTIARALSLNEDLTEAIALGHDLGHTPFGHAGEKALNAIYSRGFRHNIHSLRVVDFLEKKGQGLNLSYEVRDGILKHSKWGKSLTHSSPFLEPCTLEGRIVKICDRIAYINHDLDDALRIDFLSIKKIPPFILNNLGKTHSQRINKIVEDLIIQSQTHSKICMSPKILEALENTRNFLFEKVYFHPQIAKEGEKAGKVLQELYFFYIKNHEILLEKTKDIAYPKSISVNRRAIDYIASMTDNFALEEYKKNLLPKKWPQNFYED